MGNKICTHSEILYNVTKEEDLDKCQTTDEPWDHYTREISWFQNDKLWFSVYNGHTASNSRDKVG